LLFQHEDSLLRKPEQQDGEEVFAKITFYLFLGIRIKIKTDPMKNSAIILNLCLLLSSCASHFGMISSSPLNRNVVYEDIAYGVAQSGRCLGMGGLSQDALVLEAKRELMKNRPLKQDEQYQNFTVDFKRSFWPFFAQTKVTVSADVIKFTEDKNSEPYSENYKAKLSRINISNDLFSVGDSIIYDRTSKAILISFLDEKTVRIEYKTDNDKVRTKKISIDEIFTNCKPYKEYMIGGRFVFTVEKSGYATKETSGRIMALGLKSLIVKDNQYNLHVINYKK
jgi:hypothetical protein